jgi:hypothetical protein
MLPSANTIAAIRSSTNEGAQKRLRTVMDAHAAAKIMLWDRNAVSPDYIDKKAQMVCHVEESFHELSVVLLYHDTSQYVGASLSCYWSVCGGIHDLSVVLLYHDTSQYVGASLS